MNVIPKTVVWALRIKPFVSLNDVQSSELTGVQPHDKNIQYLLFQAPKTSVAELQLIVPRL